MAACYERIVHDEGGVSLLAEATCWSSSGGAALCDDVPNEGGALSDAGTAVTPAAWSA